MAIDKAVDSTQLNAALTATANAIRTAGGASGQIAWNASTGFASAISEIGGGFYPSLLITAPTGHTLTATNGTDTVTLSEISEGSYWGEVTDYGEWAVSGDGGGIGQEVNVTEVAEYTGRVAYISTTLNDNDWETIAAVSSAGTGADYWAIGDCHEVTLNGSIGTLSLSNKLLYVFILHFNLPDNKNVAENNIIWGGFKTSLSGGKDVGLVSAKYSPDDSWNGYVDGSKQFNLNHWGNNNHGGWKGCDLRYDILGAVETQPSDYGKAHTTSCVGYDATVAAFNSPKSGTLMAALPADFRAALGLWNRWIDAVGNKSNVDANIQKTVDAGISIPTEFEVQGTRSYANQYEQNHQTQFAYYANGNSKVKYKHNADGTAACWWCSSAGCSGTGYFCFVGSGGGADGYGAYFSLALAPAFKT